MGKLFDRVARLEDKLDNREEIKYLTQKMMEHDEKIMALAAHLDLEFKDARFNLRPRNEN